MDRAQTFIKECLFTKNFTNPDKPIDEKRLTETLLLLPTDGGLSSKMKRTKSQLKINIAQIANTKGDNDRIIHPNYREINKNSKYALKQYINDCKSASKQATALMKKQNINTKEGLERYLLENNRELFNKLPQYGKFLPMYREFWLNYIKELLSIPETVNDTSKLNINGPNTMMRLSMADYNGALLRVTKSKNKNMIGTQGIVIWDSQKDFIMVTKGKEVDEIKCIPKKSTVFTFEIPINDEDALQYSILGDRFKYRSIDRANRKFKSRRTDDMLYYVYDKIMH